MRLFKSFLRVLLSCVQVAAFLAPFALHYFGTHTMGAHRHLKVRANVYMSGILNDTNLTIAAIASAALLALLLIVLFSARKNRTQKARLWPVALIALDTSALLLVLVLSVARGLLIFPWLVFCAVLIWLLQVIKAALLERQEFTAQIKACLARRKTGETQ
jgi:hypothetical protein